MRLRLFTIAFWLLAFLADWGNALNDHFSGALWCAFAIWLLAAFADYANRNGQFPALQRLARSIAPYLETWGFQYTGDLSSRLRNLELKGKAIRSAIEQGGTTAEARSEMIRKWREAVCNTLREEAPDLYLVFESPNFITDIFVKTRYESNNNRLRLEQTLALNSGTNFPDGATLSDDEITDLAKLEQALDPLRDICQKLEGITVLSRATFS
jgi:hypothetical protein